MAHRLTPEELRSVLQNFEQSADLDGDDAVIAALKRIVENHIGALEILRALSADSLRPEFPAAISRIDSRHPTDARSQAPAALKDKKIPPN